jgi:hypothetical protein
MYSVLFGTLTYRCLYFSFEIKLVFSPYTKDLPNTKWCTFYVSNSLRDFRKLGRSGDRIPVGGEIFRTRPDRPWDPSSILYNGYRVFPGGKTPGAWRWTSPPSSAEVKERAELDLLLPLWAFVACSNVNLTFYFYSIWGKGMSGTVVPKVCSADFTGSATSSQGIRGYIYVMVNRKFI